MKFKRVAPNAQPPQRATKGSVGFDLTCVSYEIDELRGVIIYDTGIAVEIPNNYIGILLGRSSLYKTAHTTAHCPGVIDNDYRGTIKFVHDYKSHKSHYKPGDRVGQLIVLPCPTIYLEEVDELTPTDRGEGGFGSTGE